MTLTPMCLFLTLWFEARGEPLDGLIAVAEVVANRVADPRWPDTTCEVVTQRHQFSYYWDGSLPATDRERWLERTNWSELTASDREAFDRVDYVVDLYMDGALPGVANGAVFYHTAWSHPAWADSTDEVARIGGHVFRR